MPSGAGLYVLAVILGACLFSIVLSHLNYIRAVREEI
jgi:hypothetical protein